MSEKLFQALFEADLIDIKNREFFLFGLRQGKYLFFNALIILLLGLVFGELTSSICFFLAFAVLRSYAGGYHCSTVIRCYIVSIGLMIIVMCSLKFLVWSKEVACLAVFLAGVSLYILVPVDNNNHKLNGNEKKAFRKKALFIVNIEIVLCLLGVMLKVENIYRGIMTAMITTAALACIGYIKNVVCRRS